MSYNCLLEETYGSTLGHLYSKPYCETIIISTLNFFQKGIAKLTELYLMLATARQQVLGSSSVFSGVRVAYSLGHGVVCSSSIIASNYLC